ncbi:hypothetical protein P0Y35_05785 [Kiritimatiellaeota bacterium B1221]|nr:hypothetical protein [Kiritimatiellaeota bacterium B1221]
MKFFRTLSLLFLITPPLLTRAQNVFENHPPVGQNVRLAWAIDADDGVDDGQYSGFEFAYASQIYPLDQMIISYSFASPNDSSKHAVGLSLEEFYPLAENFKLYGVAGFGYMWTDFAEGEIGDSTGWFGKFGGGAIFVLNDAFDLYAELAYFASDRDLWYDGDNAVASTNLNALLGFRFKY